MPSRKGRAACRTGSPPPPPGCGAPPPPTGAARQEKAEPRRVWEALEKERCTLLMAVPTIYQRLMGEWEKRERKPDLHGMRVFISGSAPLSHNLFHRFERATGFRILERYGMTETGMNTSNRIDPAHRKAGSVGYPLPGVKIRVVGTDGKDVRPGDVGEVWVLGG